MLGGCAASAVRSAAKAPRDNSDSRDFLVKYGPIDRGGGEIAPARFSGDDNTRPHSLLWKLPEYLATHKVESEEDAALVVVGGGMSGLFTTYQFRKFQPVLLEQAPRFGGNAKGQTWRGMAYSLGSAYLDLPRPGTPMAEYYNELKLEDILVGRPSSDPGEYNGKIYAGFWEGESEPNAKHSYARMNRFFEDLCAEKERPFPFVPSLTAGQRESLRHYDRENLHACLSRVMGGKIPPHLETALEYYCWSTYAASAKELSAAAALNFLAQESNPIRIGAGGNARVGERLLERLAGELPRQNLRPGSVVVQVKADGDRTSVLYEDANGKLRRIRAKAVVMSCPKFVAAKVIDGLEPERLAAISRLKYRSYMTAHLLLKKRPKQTFYDLFMTGNGRPDYAHFEKWQERTNATDFVLGNFADPRVDVSIFTFYRAFPYDGARAQLYKPDAYSEFKKRFEDQIARQILPMFNLRQTDIADLRLTLWGHALPVAAQGIYSDNTIDQLRAPFRGRIFFIEQDNWAYPSTQTGGTDSILLRDEIRKVLA